jgi:hypothetical protein
MQAPFLGRPLETISSSMTDPRRNPAEVRRVLDRPAPFASYLSLAVSFSSFMARLMSPLIFSLPL